MPAAAARTIRVRRARRCARRRSAASSAIRRRVNACNGNDVVTCNADGTFGSVVRRATPARCAARARAPARAPPTASTSSTSSTRPNDFLSFDPRKLPGDPFTQIGTLELPDERHLDPGIRPARDAVLDGGRSRRRRVGPVHERRDLQRVDSPTAACTAVGLRRRAPAAWMLFGMGFVTDTAGADTEKLYLAGGDDAADAERQARDGRPREQPATPTVVGTVAGAVERLLPRAHRHERGEAVRRSSRSSSTGRRSSRRSIEDRRRAAIGHAVEPRHERPRPEHPRLGVRAVGRRVLRVRHDRRRPGQPELDRALASTARPARTPSCSRTCRIRSTAPACRRARRLLSSRRVARSRARGARGRDCPCRR